MLTTLAGGCVANLGVDSAPTGHVDMFREVTVQLAPHYAVKLDERQFREISIDGPGWTYTSEPLRSQKKLAIRVIRGSATFRNSMDKYSLRQILNAGNWLYVPSCGGFTMTSGSSSADYPCVFVLAHMQ